MFDFAECLSRSVRFVLPRIAERGLAFTFDVDVPSAVVRGDLEAAERALYRVLLHAVPLIDAGLLAILGLVDDKGRPKVRVTGAGALAGGRRLEGVLDELALASSDAGAGAMLVAVGHCPVVGGEVVLIRDPAEGFVLELTLPFPWAGEQPPVQPSAHGATAWVRLPENARSVVFKRRLERLGWNVVLFSPQTAHEDALRQLRTEPPALLMAHVRQNWLDAGVVDWLNLPLAAEVPRVLAVPLGHPALEQLDSPYRVQALPFSPRDLALLTAEQAPNFEIGSMTGPLAASPSATSLLIVDDNPVNQAVMSAMAEAMGYSVLQATDGQQAVEICLRTPPSAVLMDVNMPVLDGIEATRRIRELQSSGDMAPFPILGASADATPANAGACLIAGMDTFIAKPLMIADVSAQLRRLSLDVPRSTSW